MNCEQVSLNLSRYYDGEMNETESQQCAEHIRCCESCRRELQTFQSVSSAMLCCQEPCCAPAWELVAGRLDAKAEVNSLGPQVCEQPKPASIRRTSFFNYPAIGLGLAIAASLFLLAAWQINFGSTTSEIAVDLSSVIDRYASEPSQALAQLNKQYSGKTVETAQLKGLLGYAPITPEQLASDVQLISTSVLHLPVCSCKAGKCTCGPAGCNCAAMLCRRSDGTELLVLEHCDSEKVKLSQQPVRLVDATNKRMQLFGADTNLIASWVANDHRLTAIGLRSENEAMSLRN